MERGDEERPDRPEYKVHRSRRGAGRRGAGRAEDGERPPYTVYRSSRSPLAKLRGAWRQRGQDEGEEEPAPPRPPGEKPTWRKVGRYALIGAGLWFLLSVVLFAVSAQIQKGKLNDGAADAVGAFPLMVAEGQTILVIGTDARPAGTNAAEVDTRKKCVEQAAAGDPPSGGCGSFRADTLLLLHAGGGAFEKLSIPRDALANIPGLGAGKINSAFANGGAELQIETVEEFLGIDIDHVVILDFEGFADFIDAVGGVEVRLTDRLKSKIDGGAGQCGITLELDRGEHTLDGQEALAFARTRKNLRNPGEDDLDRAQRQQQVLSGIKNRLTSIWRAPINFIRGPWIAWNAPKAMVSDMGGLSLPQLALSAAIGGDPGTKILGKRASATPAGNLVIPVEDCEKAVRKLLGGAGPRPPLCSPPA